MHTQSVEMVRLEEDKSMHEWAYSRVWMNSLIFYASWHSSLCVSRCLSFCFIVYESYFASFFIQELAAHSVSWDTHMYSTYTATSPLHFLLFSAGFAWFSVCPHCIPTSLCLVIGSISQYWHLCARYLHSESVCTWNLELGLNMPRLFD